MHELIEELLQFHSAKARVLYDMQTALKDIARHEARVRKELDALYRSFQLGQEIAHHRNEELVLRELRKTDAPIHRRVEEISDEHVAFGRIVAGTVAMIGDRSVNPRVLSAEVERFVTIYDEHATNEELIFFPIADKYLTPVHWKAVRRGWVI